MFIARADTIGGSQRHVLDVSMRLRSLGHAVVVFTGPAGPYSLLLASKGIEAVTLPRLSRRLLSPFEDYAVFRNLLAELTSYRPDVVALHSSKSGVIGRLVARKLGIPSVYTLHGVAFGPAVAPAQRLVAWIAELALRPVTSAVIAVSSFDRDVARAARIVSANRITVIWNGLADKPPSSVPRGVGRASTRLLMIARFSEPKDQLGLIRALAQLPDTPGWSMQFVGDGEREEEARALCEELGIANRVDFAGLVSDTEPYMEASDVVVLLSDREGLPMAILEAMRAGRPVLASAVGGIPEIVDETVGWPIPPRSPTELRSALLAALDPECDLRALGKKSRERYLASFGLDECVRKTVKVYDSLVQR